MEGRGVIRESKIPEFRILLLDSTLYHKSVASETRVGQAFNWLGGSVHYYKEALSIKQV